MVQFSKVASTVAAAAFIAPSLAHPGEHHDHHAVKREIAAREHLADHFRRSVDTCSGTEKSASLAARSVARRNKIANELRLKRGIASSPQKFRRDLATLEKFEAVNHNQTDLVDGDYSSFEASVFSANTSCVLTPEVTDGPYYVTGEQIRKNVKEDLYSDGVDLYLEVQYIDITTCEPVPNVWVDIWNANATGVYSGISTSGNYAADGLNSTYLRYAVNSSIRQTLSDSFIVVSRRLTPMASPHSRLSSLVTTKVSQDLLVQSYIFANNTRSCNPYPPLVPHERYGLPQQHHLGHEQYYSYRPALLGHSSSRCC